MALSQSKVDVFVEDESSLSSEEMKRLGLRIAFYGDEAIPCGFPMRKNEPGLRDSLSYFIDSLIATGEIKKMVYNNLIVENRWTYITDGLWETVKISVFAILLGSLVGAGVCWMRMSRRKWLAKTSNDYDNYKTSDQDFF